MENNKKNRYVVVDKRGKEIYHSDGFFSFIFDTFINCLLSGLAIAAIGSVVCGIASIFG
jgi:hypothetical protein